MVRTLKTARDADTTLALRLLEANTMEAVATTKFMYLPIMCVVNMIDKEMWNDEVCEVLYREASKL